MAESAPPSWIDAAFIQEALRRSGDADTVVTSVTVKRVGAPGDNYASLMFRVTAETNAESKSLITKILPPGEVTQRTIKEANLFGVESLMLGDIVPRMHRILEDAAPGRFPPFSAKCLHHEHGDREFLVLEDLAPQGFRLADRHRGLGLRHSLLALRTLARFHAVSVALLSQDPTLYDQLPNPYRSSKSQEEMYNFISSSWQNIADMCRKWPDSESKYADDIEALKYKAFEKYKVNNDCVPGRFNVIAHGDFWLNNMMMAYEEKELKDIRLVDLQISHVTSPAIDILYFLNTSVSEDVYLYHSEMLIREYHKALMETMELLGFTAPSLQEILDELEVNGFFATFGGFGVLPIVKANKVFDFEKSLVDGKQENEFMCENSSVERWLRILIPVYSQRGLLSL